MVSETHSFPLAACIAHGKGEKEGRIKKVTRGVKWLFYDRIWHSSV
jgi:hypothetical protein